jgi:hypothetical protein
MVLGSRVVKCVGSKWVWTVGGSRVKQVGGRKADGFGVSAVEGADCHSSEGRRTEGSNQLGHKEQISLGQHGASRVRMSEWWGQQETLLRMQSMT